MNVGELFSFEPLIGSDILAGWSGRDNAVRSVVRIKPETVGTKSAAGPVNSRFFTEALLVVDLSQHQSQDLACLITECLAGSPAGLLLCGPCCPVLETPLVESAAARNIPLLYSPLPDAAEQLDDTYRIVADLEKNKKFGRFVRDAVYAFLKGKDQEALCSFLASRLDNPVLVFNNAFQVLYSAFPQKDGFQALGLTQREMIAHCCLQLRDKAKGSGDQGGSRRDNLTLENGRELNCLTLPLAGKGYGYGFLTVLEINGPLVPADEAYLQAARDIFLESLIQRRSLESIENKHKSDFIHDLLYNNFESREEIINRGKHWGFSLDIRHQLLVIEPHSTEKNLNLQEMMDKIELMICEAVSYANCHSVVGQVQDQIVLIIPETSFKNQTISKENAFSLAGALHKKLKNDLPAISLAIGIGKHYPSLLDLSRSFQEAKLAIELGKIIYDKQHITHFEDLGIIRLLASIDFLQLDEYYREYLGEIMVYDSQNESNLLETLLLYFKYNGDINTVAQKMYIHPNSLRYRLKKIEELSHVDLRNYEDMLNLFIACKIAVMKAKFE